jgi:ArsR family transcriptional regulator
MAHTELPVLSPRERQAGGCCAPAVLPDLDEQAAARVAAVGKALGDPTRVRILDVLRKAAPEALCQCELLPLFDMSQPALSKHLRVLTASGLIESERRGVWAYYFPRPDALQELTTWLT